VSWPVVERLASPERSEGLVWSTQREYTKSETGSKNPSNFNGEQSVSQILPLRPLGLRMRALPKPEADIQRQEQKDGIEAVDPERERFICVDRHRRPSVLAIF